MKKAIFFALLTLTSLIAKPQVSTSILPTKYFVEQIAGDTLYVNVMVEKGSDPHTYEPKPKQMQNLEKSKIYFAVGIEFEDTWLERFSKNYPNLKIIRTDKDIKKIYMDGHSHAHHDHSHDHSHDGHHHHHSSLDPHIWLDPMLVKRQIKIITKALIDEFPQNKEIYEANLKAFSTKLDSIHKFIEEKLLPFKDSKFIVYHPSWGYFAKRYDLIQIPIEVEGKEPKPAQMANIIKEAKEHSIKVIFVAPQFSKKSATTIAKQTGAKVVEIDQLPYEWEKEMIKTTDIFVDSLK